MSASAKRKEGLLMLKPSGRLRVVSSGMARKVRSLVSHKRAEAGPRDYYEVLRVHPTADASMIREAYWHLARRYQADIGVEADAARQLDELNEAYSVLGTPSLRESYDESMQALRTDEGVETLARPETARSDGGEPKPDARKPPTAKKEETPKEEGAPGVIRWEMPTLQAVVATVGLVILGALALWYGAPVLVTVILAGVALFCTLFPWRFGRILELPLPDPERTHGEPQVDAAALRASTAAIVARWRQEAGLQPRPSTKPGATGDADAKGGPEHPGEAQ